MYTHAHAHSHTHAHMHACTTQTRHTRAQTSACSLCSSHTIVSVVCTRKPSISVHETNINDVLSNFVTIKVYCLLICPDNYDPSFRTKRSWRSFPSRTKQRMSRLHRLLPRASGCYAGSHHPPHPYLLCQCRRGEVTTRSRQISCPMTVSLFSGYESSDEIWSSLLSLVPNWKHVDAPLFVTDLDASLRLWPRDQRSPGDA